MSTGCCITYICESGRIYNQRNYDFKLHFKNRDVRLTPVIHTIYADVIPNFDDIEK